MANNNKVCCLICKSEVTTSNFSKHFESKQCKGGSKYIRSKQYEDRLKRTACIYCNKEFQTVKGLTSHESKCKKNPKSKQSQHNKEGCIYCNKILPTTSGKDAHERTCALNPSRILSQNQFTKAKLLGKPSPIVSKETREKMSKSNSANDQWTDERKIQQSNIMRETVLRNPDSYSGNYNRGHVKQKICSNGFKVLGSWEYLFVEFCILHNITIIQPTIPFSYTYDKDRLYFPDFYLPDLDSYVEVKGFKTEKDDAKWKAMTLTHNKNLMIISKEQILKIKNNTFCFERS